jgi:hypothetical protein
MQQVFLVLGPSGVGKSYVSGLLAREWALFYWRIYNFEANGVPSEWDGHGEQVDVAMLMAAVHARRTAQGAAGTVVSIAPEDVLEPRQLIEARDLGATPVVLWGTPDECVQARSERSKKNRKRFNEKDMPRYWEKNSAAFEAYCRPEYLDFRVEAFRPDGSRWLDEEWVERVRKHERANQRIQRTADSK